MSFLDIEQLIIKTVAIDGEIFVRLVISPSLPMGFALELIDADRLDLNFNTAMDSRTNTFVVQGIEMDKFGKPVAYHFWSAHPDDAGVRPIERTRIPASDILHLYRPDRPGRVRGIPWTAPSMYFLARLHELMDAELVAAQAGASQLATIEQPMGDSSAYMNQTADVTAETIDLPQGIMIRLAPGEKMNPWISNKPNTAFNPFIKTILHGIASALNVSYSSLASDTSEENYASGRLGILLEREYFKTLQSWLIRNLHQKIYPIWLDCAMSTGTITLPTGNAGDYDEVMWRGRRWPWADPFKELKAFEGAINLNLISKTAVCAETGTDYIDVLGERFEEEKREREYAKELVEMGLPPIAPAVAPVAPIVEDDVPDKPDTETEDTQDE
jgi:lambda family phage portal protein